MARQPSSAQITLRALVTARWVLLGLLASAGAIAVAWPARSGALFGWLPVRPAATWVIAILVTWGGANLATDRLIVRRGRATRLIAGVHLLVDAVALTVLLAISGGATNPFTTLYFVPITLATQVSPRWTWSLAGFTLACFGALFLFGEVPAGSHGHEAHYAGHLRGMWIAFGVSGALITYFVHRIALSLSRQREQLRQLQHQAAEDRHLASLGSLAAGAAHELGTPLGTITVLAGELPHLDVAARDEALQTIRSEVARCKTIVGRMRSPELRVSELGPQAPWHVSTLAEAAKAPTGAPVEITVSDAARDGRCSQPQEVLAQIVRELVSNAIEACRGRPEATGVRVAIDVAGHAASITVADDGAGMDSATKAAVFDPFFSTKPEGQGMGLGLYLARAQLRQLGGDIMLDSEPGAGTRVRVSFPLQSTSVA